MYSWPEPAVFAVAPSVTWGAHEDEKINKDSRQIQMLTAARLAEMSLYTPPAEQGMSVKIGNIEMSHMLHFSSWETFLCSSWLCELQAAILQQKQVST